MCSRTRAPMTLICLYLTRRPSSSRCCHSSSMVIPRTLSNSFRNPSTELVAFRPFTQIFRYTLSVQHTQPTSLMRPRLGRKDPDGIATDDRSMPTDLPWLSPEKDPRRIGSPLGRTTHASQERTDIQNRAEVPSWTGSIRVGSASCGKSSAYTGYMIEK